MKNITITFSLILISLLLSSHIKNDIKITKCTLIKSIDVLPDSSIMSGALNMQFKDDYIYFIEEKNNQMIKLKSDFSDNTTIGRHGSGPTELIKPRNFFFIEDTIYIIDMESWSIKSFTHEDKFIDNYRTYTLSEQRLFTENKTLYLGFFNPELRTCISNFSFITNKEKELDINYFGKPYVFNEPFKNHIRNKRDLVRCDNYFYTVSDNQPIIEKYNLDDNNLIEKFDYSFLPIIKRNLNVIKSRPSYPSTYTAFADNSQIYNESIYILISQQEEKHKKNIIMKVDLKPTLQVTEIYLLPGQSYTTFCVSNENYIYAFNNSSASVEKIKLSED